MVIDHLSTYWGRHLATVDYVAIAMDCFALMASATMSWGSLVAAVVVAAVAAAVVAVVFHHCHSTTSLGWGCRSWRCPRPSQIGFARSIARWCFVTMVVWVIVHRIGLLSHIDDHSHSPLNTPESDVGHLSPCLDRSIPLPLWLLIMLENFKQSRHVSLTRVEEHDCLQTGKFIVVDIYILHDVNDLINYSATDSCYLWIRC